MTTPTLAAVIRTAIENRLADVHVMLPGKIDKYDATTQKADVLPLIMRYQQGGDENVIKEKLPVIPNVPVVFPRVGKFAVTFPVKTGDNVALVFCESPTDTYQLGGGRSPISPDMLQRFDLSDAIAIPGWYPDGKALAPTDGENIVIGKDGLESYFVALANLVLGELNDVKADLEAFKAISEAHTHGYIPGSLTAAVTTPPSATGTGVPPITWPTPHDPQSVAAQKVKAT